MSKLRHLVALDRIITLFIAAHALSSVASANALEFVRPSDDGKSFVGSDSRQTIQLWGVNYDHDGEGRLIEDYWHDEWPRVVEDFAEIKALGANSVRIHLQLGRFMQTADEPDARNLAQLKKLIELAERQRLYLILTGLGCYHRADVPAWYDALPERDRWDVQAAFWRAIARVGRGSPAVFAYDLMNEPILPGEDGEDEWLAPPLGDKHFVQRLALVRGGRSREEIAGAWVAHLAAAIRELDDRHMLTVGVIPWAHYFRGAKPLFYSPQVGGPLDFVSVHFYPKKGKVDEALTALRVYEVGKPLVIEEMFPLHSSAEELLAFVDGSAHYADGWISFYWGQTIDECRARGDMSGAITADWLEKFRDHGPSGALLNREED